MCDYGWNGSNVGHELAEMRKKPEPKRLRVEDQWDKLKATGMAWEFFPQGFQQFKKHYEENLKG